MHLNDFSDLILKLNRSVAQNNTEEHQQNLISLLKGLIQFEAAWWGWSNFKTGRNTLVNTNRFGLSPSFESAFGAVAHLDPFIQHGRSAVVFSKSMDAKNTPLHKDYRAFLKAFRIGSIVNGHCRLEGESDFNFFMSLYRPHSAPPFSEEETGDFRLILQHLEQSLSLSLRSELRGLRLQGGEAAIVSANGAIVRHTAGFRACLAQAQNRKAMQERLLVDLATRLEQWSGNGQTFLSTDYRQGLRLIRQTQSATGKALSPQERVVAELFSSGLSMRQISDRKGVSVHTVRNQVASIYRKTGVSNKIGLAKLLSV